MAKILVVLLWIVGAVVVVGGLAGAWAAGGARRSRSLQIGEIDLTTVPDGTYQGTHRGGRFNTRVEVMVADHRITNIKVLKDVMVVIPDVSKKTFAAVLSKQSLAVDTVSGATANTKVYLKAIENALQGARQ